MSTSTGKRTDRKLLTEIAESVRRQHDLRLIHVDPDGAGVGWQLALQKARELSPQTLGRLVFADPDTDQHRPEKVATDRWIRGAQSSVEVLQRLAAMAIVGQMWQLCESLPVFQHTCPRCIYLGRMRRQESAEIGESIFWPRVFVDLYACTTHTGAVGLSFLARHGDADDNCLRDSITGAQTEPHLAEAFERYRALADA